MSPGGADTADHDSMKIKINVNGGSISISRVAELCGGRVCGGDAESLSRPIRYICTDSREVGEGVLFAAIVGERVDGHDYINSAAAAGAAAVLGERVPAGVDPTIPIILTDGTVAALSSLAAGFADSISACKVAVTGSVGKTTTKEFIAAVLAAHSSDCRVFRTEGNKNSTIGMPLTMLSIPADAEYAVLEMGMSGFGEIEAMSLAARPDIAVITNIGSSHLEFLKTRENIARAKLEVRAGLAPGGTLLLNGDEPLLADAGRTDSRAVYFSAAGDRHADFYISELTDSADGCTFTLHSSGRVIKDIKIPVRGRHNAQAALIAAAIGIMRGLCDDEIRCGAAAFRPAAMRQAFISAGGLSVIEDCYNASPESMRAAIDVLVSAAAERGGIPAAILGDMGELGEGSAAMHRAVGEYFASRGGGFLIAFGPMSAHTARGAAAAGLSPECIVRIADITSEASPRIAAEAARRTLGARDCLLIKASRSVRAERIVEALRAM